MQPPSNSMPSSTLGSRCNASRARSTVHSPCPVAPWNGTSPEWLRTQMRGSCCIAWSARAPSLLPTPCRCSGTPMSARWPEGFVNGAMRGCRGSSTTVWRWTSGSDTTASYGSTGSDRQASSACFHPGRSSLVPAASGPLLRCISLRRASAPSASSTTIGST